MIGVGNGGGQIIGYRRFHDQLLNLPALTKQPPYIAHIRKLKPPVDFRLKIVMLYKTPVCTGANDKSVRRGQVEPVSNLRQSGHFIAHQCGHIGLDVIEG